MVKDRTNSISDMVVKQAHRCSVSCLGPLTFHTQVTGAKVHLSQNGCRAAKTSNTFKNGLVFSNRPVKIQERIRLLVEKTLSNWHGALRVGFTTVPPTARASPLPCMAIPNLTDTPGHWAAPVPEDFCPAGSVLEFWVSNGGSVYVLSDNSPQCKILSGVDLSRPLWAMVDVYGQTCSVLLLGSEKRQVLHTRKSCPTLENPTSPNIIEPSDVIPNVSSNSSIPVFNTAVTTHRTECVVCYGSEDIVTLRPCGHQCLCPNCVFRVWENFGTCPLCRQKIQHLSEEMGL